MKALIFGGAGMLAQAVAAEWRRHDAEVVVPPEAEADVCSRRPLLDWAERSAPEVVVNCAALTAVDDCESRRLAAFDVNGCAVANVAAAAECVDARLIHVSTDYVFGAAEPGDPPQPFKEEDDTAPLSIYGESKLLGEHKALGYERALVVRTSWLFGPGGPNFVATIRRLLAEGKTPLKVVDDQVGCPTWTPFLARAIWDLAALKLQGVVHYCNRDAVSWYGFAREIARRVAPAAEVRPVTTAEFPRPAPRPAYSVLDVNRFETMVGRPVEPWADGLTAYLDIPGERS